MEESHLELLREKMEYNERLGQKSFDSFSDLEMIYYYIHKPNHIDEDKDKTTETKNEYRRDLLQFYEQLLSNKDFLRHDVIDFDESSLFRSLRKRHIRRYQNWLKEEKQYAISTRARKVVVLKSFLKWLYEQDYIQEKLHTAFTNNEVRSIDRPNRDLSYHEVKSLLDHYQDHVINYAILSLLATTGLRIREIANAKWRDLYYDSVNKRYYLRVMAKGKKRREAIIFNNVFKRIIAFRERRGLSTVLDPHDETPLLTTRTNKPYTYKYLSQYVTRIIQNSKLPFLAYKQGNVTPHWFRHFFAIYSLQNGVEVAYIQQTLGHEDIRTTQIYLDSELQKLNNAANNWSEEMF